MPEISGANLPIAVGSPTHVWVQDQAGSAPTRMPRAAFSAIFSEPYIDDVGSPVSGDWTAVFQKAADDYPYQVFRLRPNTTYIHREQALWIPTPGSKVGGLIGAHGAKIYLPAADWGTTDATGNRGTRLASNVCAFYARGHDTDGAPAQRLTGWTMRDLTIESEVSPGRIVVAMAARNIDQIDVSGNEVFGLPCGFGFVGGTLSGNVSYNYFHDFAESLNPYSIQPQASGIEIDNFDLAGYSSDDLTIAYNRIARILFTGAALIAWGDQTDGINVQSLTDGSVGIIGNHIQDVGEGIDNFSPGARIIGNKILRCSNIGIKVIYASVGVPVIGNQIIDSGHSGVFLKGGNGTDIIGNLVQVNKITNVNTTTGLLVNTACVFVDHNSSGGGSTADNIVTNNYLDPGTDGHYCIYDSAARTVTRPNVFARAGVTATLGGTGNVSNILDATVTEGAPISLSNNTPVNLGSLALTKGEWELDTTFYFTPAATTNITQLIGTTGTLSATLNFGVNTWAAYNMPAGIVPNAGMSLILPARHLSVLSDTTYYASVRALFTVSTLSVYGRFRARRV